MTEVKTRLIEKKDFGKIIELTNEWVTKENNDIRLEMFLECMDNPNYHVMVVEVDGQIVGFLSFTIFKCWIRCFVQLNIHGIYIQREWRNHGFGTKLHSAMLNSFNCDILFVSSSLDWYKKLGYNLGGDKLWVRWNK